MQDSKVAAKGEFLPLHEWCMRTQSMPSRAYALSGCTSKWKQQPADRFIAEHPLVAAAHERGERVMRWIGYDADEPLRAKRMAEKDPNPHLWEWRAPLVEWDIGRDDCDAIIERAGLPNPGKSSCFMCPSLKKDEIVTLQRRYPALAAKALEIEANAPPHGTIKGLGRAFAWADVLAEKETGPEVCEEACGCYDG